MKKQDIQKIIMKYFLSKQKTKQSNFLIYKEGSIEHILTNGLSWNANLLSFRTFLSSY